MQATDNFHLIFIEKSPDNWESTPSCCENSIIATYRFIVPTKAETAYPRLKNYVTSRELTEIYTPTQQELALASQYTKKGATKLGFLVRI